MTSAPVTVFGVVAVLAALVTYANQRRSHWFTFAFAWACVLVGVYAFMSGVFVIGMLQLAWYLVAMRRWVERQEYE